MTGGGDVRQAELVTALGAVRSRIAKACESVGRDPQEVTLVAVTKNRPAADVRTLVRLGVHDIGENKDQEARAKIAELAETSASSSDSSEGGRIRWHMVGRVQSNKARHVAQYADAVHSVDRARLVRVLAAALAPSGRVLDVFLQVSLDGDPERGGVAPDALAALANEVVARPALRLRGVMAVPPMTADPDAAFARLAELSQVLRSEHPGADAMSAGMSSDLEAAIRHGSTHVRVGSALLGPREPNLG